MKKIFILSILFAMISCSQETEINKFVLTNKETTHSILSGTEYHLVWMNIETHEKFVHNSYNGDKYFKYEVGDTIAFEVTKNTRYVRVK